MQTVLRNPRRKKRCRAVLYQCLPIPFEGAGPDDWPNYQAYLQDGLISVENPDSMFQLYNMGYFGKGILSRSGPTYNKRHFTDQGERILSKRKYERHLDWEKRAERFKEENDEFEDDFPANDVNEADKLYGSRESLNQECLPNILDTDNHAESEIENEKTSSQDQPKMDSSTCGPDPYILVLGNSDTDQLIGDKQSLNKEDLQQIALDNNKHVESEIENKKISSQDQSMDSSTCGPDPCILVLGNIDTNQLIGDKQSLNKEDLQHSSDNNKHVESEIENKKISSQDQPMDSSCGSDPYILVLGNIDTNQLIGDKQSLYQEDLQHSSDNNKHVESEVKHRKISSQDQKTVSGFSSVVDTSTYESDPLLLVVEDSDSDKEVEEDQNWMMKIKDPYPLWECLQLGFEETFFLAFGLGCLTVIDDKTSKKLTLTKLWRRFSHSHSNFIKNYIAYHHFRSKGWVVKDGLKYGTDFLLYKDGPPFYHGTYSVIVAMIDEDTLMPVEHFGNRTFTWPSLAGLNRVNERVAKDLLFCDVVKPSYLSDRDLKHPNCISSFKVQEILMRRWVSNQEREKKINGDS